MHNSLKSHKHIIKYFRAQMKEREEMLINGYSGRGILRQTRPLSGGLVSHARLHRFEDGSDSLSSANTHCDQRIRPSGTPEFIQSLDHEHSTSGSNGMTDRDTTAVRVGTIQWQIQIT